MKEQLQSIKYGELIRFNDERLQGITLVHSYGKKEREKGFYSVDPDKFVKETIDSSQTPFNPLILLVPPALLGTHEDTIGDPNRPEWLSEGHKKEGYTESGYAHIDFLKGLKEDGKEYPPGWNGSPLAVVAFAKVEGDRMIDNHLYEDIAKALIDHGGIGLLDLTEYGDLGILDGHHRARMAAESVTQYLDYVPVQIMPYLCENCVVLKTWKLDGIVLKAQQVFECFKDPKAHVEAKRTKFGIVGKDGITRRILDAQPDIHIPLENLRK